MFSEFFGTRRVRNFIKIDQNCDASHVRINFSLILQIAPYEYDFKGFNNENLSINWSYAHDYNKLH